MIGVECPSDPCLQEDLEAIANSELPFERMKSSTILVTGSTGLIGSQVVQALAACNRLTNLDLRILALVRNPEKARIVFGELLDRPDVDLVVSDIVDGIDVSERVDYVIHCASVTASKEMVKHPVETISTSVLGTKNVLDFAKHHHAKSVVYLSSMEVYGTFGALSRVVSERDLGIIDLADVRSCYPESKRLCENMCVGYCKEYGVPVKIVRLAQTFGAGVLPGDNRVFSQFARSVIEGEDIVLHTPGRSEGNYCYTRDVIKALIVVLLEGENGESYNVSNEASHTTILGMAELVCRTIAQDAIKVRFHIPESNVYGYAPETRVKIDSSKLRSLGWMPEVGLEESYSRMIRSMLSRREGSKK